MVQVDASVHLLRVINMRFGYVALLHHIDQVLLKNGVWCRLFAVFDLRFVLE